MDAIFGHSNFRNELVWCYTQGGRPTKDFPNKHDIILRYSKSRNFTFNSSDIRIPYELVSVKSEDSFTKVDEDGRFYKEVYGTDRKKKYRYYKDEGKVPYDWWIDIPQITGRASASKKTEKTGYPTQKPLALYQRIIKASSNVSDIVLDPFAGCATTCVAAEIMRRQWVGIDIWEKAGEVVVERMSREGLFVPQHADRVAEGTQEYLIAVGFTFSPDLPIRSDDGLPAAPYMKTVHKVQRVAEPLDKFKTRQAKLDYLLKVYGCKCAGCDREFDDPRYLELDHNAPRSTGGLNHTSNRILLCGPCNKLKSNVYTLIGLRRKNKKFGYMADSGIENPKLKKIRERRERDPGLFD